MQVAIPMEVRPGERRVAATPETVAKLIKLGFEVTVESKAGERASFRDSDYESVGGKIEKDAEALWRQADLVLKVHPPELNSKTGVHEADLLREGGSLISFVWPAKNRELIDRLAARKATVLAMDQIPRISRAQKMDALSSMANIAGYRAVIEAASFFGRFFTGQMTAAGKVPPAKVLVIGAGVAGLASIGAARGLGAIVRAFDTRPVVKEQVQSMGAEFLEVELAEDGSGEGGYAREMTPEYIAGEMALFLKQASDVDIIITTALIPGKPAPQLISQECVEAMRPGSVIVDLAAEAGGNCAVTQPGSVITHKGVTVIGFSDLPSRLAPTASGLYGNNLVHLLKDMGGAKTWHIDLDDEVVRGALILQEGELMWPPPRLAPPPAPPSLKKPLPAPPAATPAPAKSHAKASTHDAPKMSPGTLAVSLGIGAVVFLLIGLVAPPAFVAHFSVFILACFVGYQVVWNVTPALHTPLMSVTNAVSGIIIIGGMLLVNGPVSSPVTVLGAASVLLATINIVGGFLVTHRMLRMFQR